MTQMPDYIVITSCVESGTTHHFPSVEVIVPRGVVWLLGQLGIKSAVVVVPSPWVIEPQTFGQKGRCTAVNNG
jgi:hypothetical protein